MPRINHYVLSDIAEVDISDIYDYTLEAHGDRQAAAYLTGLDESFRSIVEQPRLGKRRPEIRNGLYSVLYEKHTIFYRLQDDFVRIVRVLHSRRDMPRHFEGNAL